MNNLKKIRMAHGASQQNVADYLSLSRQAYGFYESGKRQPDMDTLIKLSAFFDVSIDYIVGRSDDNIQPVKSVPGASNQMIPVLGEVPAGIPIEAIEFIVDEVELSQNLATDSHEYFGLLVSGDSMYPEYMDGDIIVVRKQETANTGDDVVAYVNGYNATLKRLIMSDKGLTLRALNPAYESKFYSNNEIVELPVKIAGIVVEQRRSRN